MPKKEKKDKRDVDGFRWYDPSKDKDKQTRKPKVSHKEYWSMVKGAFLAYLPMIIIIMLSFTLVFLLMYLWLAH
jgi:hypothetical protein